MHSNINELPDDVLGHIFSLLDTHDRGSDDDTGGLQDIGAATQVCRRWRAVIHEPGMCDFAYTIVYSGGAYRPMYPDYTLNCVDKAAIRMWMHNIDERAAMLRAWPHFSHTLCMYNINNFYVVDVHGLCGLTSIRFYKDEHNPFTLSVLKDVLGIKVEWPERKMDVFMN